MRPLAPRRPLLKRLRWALFAASLLAACDQLLEIDSPTRVPARDLDGPANASLLVHSAIADFECAFANYVAATAVLTDELYSSTSFSVNLGDRRLIQAAPSNDVSRAFAAGDCATYATAGFGYGVYTTLSTARFQAADAFRRIESFPDSLVPGNDTAKVRLLATAAAYAGYNYTLFGEGFCQAAFDAGPALTGRQVLQLAEQRFTTSINLAQADSAILNMARVGRARVRLDLAGKADSAGDASLAVQKRAEAAADARLVPQGFVQSASRTGGDPRRENVIYAHNQGFAHVSVDPRLRSLTVGGVPDPRVQVVDPRREGVDGLTPVWYQLKYPSGSSPIVIASWNEAQLIIAEAEGGQSAVDRINALRSRFPGLPLFASTDSLEIVKQVVTERRAELYLEGHRLNDRLRLGPRFSAADRTALGLAWETGRNHKNQTYGTTTCLPLPTLETDNNDSIPP